MKNEITTSSLGITTTSSHSFVGNKVTISRNNEVPSKLMGESKYSDTNSKQCSMIIEVAQWFLNQEAMSHKKLQKLCYYAYSWFLVFFNDAESFSGKINTLCQNGFEAWVHGPVCVELYQYYRGYGWNNIPHNGNKPKFSDDMEDLLNQVWTTYGSFSADQLEQLTHSETPWKKAREGKKSDEPSNEIINEKDVFDYYSRMMTE